MGYLERNSETLKTPGFSGFDSRVSGFSRVVIFGFGSGSGSKKVGLFARVSGFRVQIPITTPQTYPRFFRPMSFGTGSARHNNKRQSSKRNPIKCQTLCE